MGTFFCIYSGLDCDESERSTEHIVPVAIGGPDALTVDDVSTKANNDAGRRADASLVDSLVIKIERWRHAIEGRNGVPDVNLDGMVDVGGAKIRAKLRIGASADEDQLWIQPSVKRVAKGQYEISCHANDRERILADIQRKNGGEPLRMQTTAATSVTTIEMSPAYREDELWRGFVKMALATGRRVLGAEWARGETAAVLRAALSSPDGADWSAMPIRGKIWPHTGEDQDRFNRVMSCGEDRHVLLVVNTDDVVAFNALLFGKYNGTVQLTTHRWPGFELGHAMVVDPTKRALVELPADDFVLRRLRRDPPCENAPAPPREIMTDRL